MARWAKIVIPLLLVFIVFTFLSRACSSNTLAAFENINKKLEESNASTSKEEDAIYQELDWNSKDSILVNFIDLSDNLRDEIEQLKKEVLSGKASYKEMSNSQKLDAIFFDNSSLTERGSLFKKTINLYKNEALEIVQNDSIAQQILKDFSTEDIEGKEWIEYYYRGFPAISSVAKLSQIQSDIKHTNLKFIKEYQTLSK